MPEFLRKDSKIDNFTRSQIAIVAVGIDPSITILTRSGETVKVITNRIQEILSSHDRKPLINITEKGKTEVYVQTEGFEPHHASLKVWSEE